MLQLIISHKTRLRVLLKFFLVPAMRGHLRGLADEFGESTNAIRLELNRFEQGGLLLSSFEGNRKVFRANPDHPLFDDITRILHKHMGIDQLVENVVGKIGNLQAAYITGEMAVGRDSDTVELILVGDRINRENLDRLARKAGDMISRRIDCTVVSPAEADIALDGRRDLWKIWDA